MNTLKGADKPTCTFLPQAQALGFPHVWLKICGWPGIPSIMIGWTIGGRVHWESSARKVTYRSNFPILGFNWHSQDVDILHRGDLCLLLHSVCCQEECNCIHRDQAHRIQTAFLAATLLCSLVPPEHHFSILCVIVPTNLLCIHIFHIPIIFG